MTVATRVWILLLSVAACSFKPPEHIGDDAGTDAASADDAAPPTSTFQLLALTPSTAATGDTITLEGTFGEAVTVHFPGNVPQAATVLGAHRATVVVPATASAGELTIETGGTTVGSLYFRRTSFTLGLQSLHREYEQTDVARQMPRLTNSRSGHSTTTTGSSMYVIGGVGSSGYLGSIERAVINGDGSLGTFTVTNAKLTTARANHVALVAGTSVYLLGGVSESGPLSTIERATVNADGSLSPFTIAPVALTTPRASAVGAIIGNYLYVIGGSQSGELDTVERAQISADGSLGSFSLVSAVKLVTARSGHTCTAIGGFLYAIGGSTSSGVSGDMERAAITGDGEISTFERVAGGGLVAPRNNHTAITMGASVYVLGGLGSGGALRTIEKATIAPDGTLSPFATVSDVELATPRDGHTASIVQNHLYLIGGRNGAYLGSVERGSINGSGALAAFTVAASSALTKNINCASVATIGPYIYVIGGFLSDDRGSDTLHPVDTVERAAISADGSIGPFSPAPGTKLTTARSCHSSAIAGNYLYVIGGNGTGDGSNSLPVPLSSVERATISATGELGMFSTAPGGALVAKRASHVTAIIGSSLYVIGGQNVVNELSSVERAEIGADGTVGMFATDEFVALAVGRAYSALVVLRDQMYVFGGYNSLNGGHQGGVEQAAISDRGELSGFSSGGTTPLSSPRYGMSATAAGPSLYLLGGNSATVEGAAPEAAPIGPAGLGGPFVPVAQPTSTSILFSTVSLTIGNFLYSVTGTQSAAIEQSQLR